MKLHEWIKLVGIRQNHLARLLGVSNTRMTRIVKYGLLPHSAEMVMLYWLSNGAVRPDDYYDLSTPPAEFMNQLDVAKFRRSMRVASFNETTRS